MKGYSPPSTYPFANYILVVGIQVWLMTVGDKMSWTTRIVIGFAGCAVIAAIFPFIACLKDGVNYWTCFFVLIPYGGFAGLAQGSVYTMAAFLPFKYMGAVMFGNGLAAIFCNTLRAITLVAFPNSMFTGALVFYLVAALMLAACVCLQLFFLKNHKFYIYYLDWEAAKKGKN